MLVESESRQHLNVCGQIGHSILLSNAQLA